jgi:hypothetical protein
MKIQLPANTEASRLTFRVGEASCGYGLTSSRLPASAKEVNEIRYVYQRAFGNDLDRGCCFRE